MKVEYEELNAHTRKDLPGQFIQLSQGWVHYELDGPESGAPVVLVHGFSVPMFIWDPLFEFLTNIGLRVLRFDLYGRGFSDRPKVPNTLELFETQLLELLNALNFTSDPINLIGLSMGGAISMSFTLHHPDLISKLILVDPAGLPMNKKSYPALLKIPGIGRLLFRLVAPKLLLSHIGNDLQHPENFPSFQELFIEQFRFKGYFRSIYSTIRHFPLEGLEDEIRQLGELSLPIQLFWGEEDHVIPYPVHKQMCERLPTAEFHSIADAGHVPYIDQPDSFNPLIYDFLSL